MKDLKDIKTNFNDSAPWLIVGAVGTGKSSVADTIKSQGNFILVDDVRGADDVICAAIDAKAKLIVTTQRFSLLKTETLEKIFGDKINVVILRIDNLDDAKLASEMLGLDDDKNHLISAADIQNLSDRSGLILIEDEDNYSVDTVQF